MPFTSIEDPVKLRRLLEAVLLLEEDLSLPVLLRHFVEEACSMTGARYGALGVLDEAGTGLSEFITVGIDLETEAQIGHRPTGLGVLGLLITDPHPLRLPDIGEHPESSGFPPHHPPMTSFLGVPVTSRDEVYGNLYLTDKIGWKEFTKDDEGLVTALAQAAGIAIENAHLHQRVREIAVYDDRDRIARDLHDAVIQRLFAIGLSLQGIVRSITSAPVSERLNKAIGDIDVTIAQIRSSIFELSSPDTDDSIRATVLGLVHELHPVVGFEPTVVFEGPVESTVPAVVVEHLLFTLREGLTNVGRHAGATEASVTLRAEGGTCTLLIADNGHGMGAGARDGGLGLQNMRQRAEKLRGELTVESSDDGTTLCWRVPLDAGTVAVAD